MTPTTPSTNKKLRLVYSAPDATSSDTAVNPLSNASSDRRVQFLIKTMTEYLRAAHTLQSLAAQIELCPRQCERLFKEETGQSPLQYLHDLRMQKAAELLLTGFKKVSEIADEVGFPQVGYFNRVFKACYGCSPLIYRKQMAREKNAKKIA